MKIPLIDLRPTMDDLREEILEAITKVVDSNIFILGPEINSFEREISKYCGTSDAVGVSSGTDALLLSLMVLNVGPGDLVLTSNFSFFATAGVISRLNAKPIFVDIEPKTFNMDANYLKKILNEMDKKKLKRVKAIIPVHLYGQCANMEEIMQISKEFKIPVIEDGSQSIGAECFINGKKKKAGNIGDFGCFSFFPTKNLGGVGDGGMVTVNDPQISDLLRLKRVHGGERKYFHRLIGGNFRLDPLQAAVLRVKLTHLDKWHLQRQENAEHYNKLFSDEGLSEYVEIPLLSHPKILRHYHIFNQYVIKAENRDKLKSFLLENEIITEIYYPVPLHLQECFFDLGGKTGDFPVSETISKEVLALPIYPGSTNEMRQIVVEKISKFYKK